MMPSQKTAVVMATYKGGSYLPAQLDSILRQERLPDLVVIADDGSTDDTLTLIERFTDAAPFPVILRQNSPRLGPNESFMQALAACDADLIALCDQDDIWSPRKLRVMVDAMAGQPALVGIHSYKDVRFAAPAEEPQLVSAFDLPRAIVDGLMLPPNMSWPGMSMMLRKPLVDSALALREHYEPVFNRIIRERPTTTHDHWSHLHDTLLLTTARLLGPVVTVSETLASHRVHATNVSTRPGWTQSEGMLKSWGDTPDVPYRLIGQFCADFAGFLAETPQAAILGERAGTARSSYEHWSEIWFSRGILRVERRRSVKLGVLARLSRRGAYLGRFRGGLGVKSLAKDAALSAGLLS